MKIFRKMMALMLAVIMCMAMSIVSFAYGNPVITVPEGDTHTYDVYQIFTGTLDGSTLSNVKWGQNGNGTGSVDKTILKTIEAITGTDAEKAAALAQYANLTSTPIIQSLTKDTPEADRTVAPGYYLIKDNDRVELADGDEHTLYIVQVVKDLTIERKANNVEAHKTSDDANDSDTTAAADNGKKQTSSDYDIGDDVPYHLTATLSEKVGNYKKYHIEFVDKLESGKFDAISALTIKMNNNDIEDTDDYTVSITGADGATKDGFDVTIEWTPKDGKNLASLAGKTVTIDFTAKLGEGANIGELGNKNTFHLEYSNNPNSTDGSDEGKTPEENVITFTYKVVVDKYDEDGTTPLENAGFTLYKVSKTDAEAGVTGADAAAKNTAWAEKKIQTWTVNAEDGKTLGKKNRFSFKGIDDGYYVLCETTTPTGYNTMEPQVFKVTATHGGDNNKGLTLDTLNGDKVSGTITFTPDKEAGALNTDVKNEKGATLPSTGGMGTTLFYVLGAILVLGGGVVLISRRRMEA